MAPRTKVQVPVGSAQWVQDENRQIAQFFTQEVEDFTFSARNEIEWLNEHMAEIFSKNQVNVTEIFKTPGKLRGKTPRTNRKRNPMEVRQPLTDMFTTNAPLNTSRLQVGTPSKTIPKFQVATDPAVSAAPKLDNPHTDSGYHGTSEDDMDVDMPAVVSSLSVEQEKVDNVVSAEMVANKTHGPTTQKARERTTEGSFHSAKEEIPMTGTHKGSPEAAKDSTETVTTEMPDPSPVNDPCLPSTDSVTEVPPNETMDLVEVENDSVLAENPSLDASHPSSADSTPAKTLLRKSSLTFAALPAREPLTTKKSIGTRVSGTTHYDQNRGTISRGSVLGRYTGGKSLGGLRPPDHVQDQPNEEMDVDKPEKPAPSRNEVDDGSKMAPSDEKSSIQRLNEKMDKLEDPQLSVPTKSVPKLASISRQVYPTLVSDAYVPYSEQTTSKNPVATGPIENDDDDWIQPPKVPQSGLKRPEADGKFLSSDRKITISQKITDGRKVTSINESVTLKESSPLEKSLVPDTTRDKNEPLRSPSGANLRSPLKRGETGQVKPADNKFTLTANSAAEAETLSKPSTTPYGTPSSKRYADGPLSASKSKLQSIMKTARGLFTSSAGVSAQAKMETLSPHSMKTRGQARAPVTGENSDTKLKPTSSKETASSQVPADREAQRIELVKSKNSESSTEGRRTRSSAEKDERKRKEAREQERVNKELQVGGEAEGQRALVEQRESAAPTLQKALQATKEMTSAMAGPPSKPIRQSPRRAQNLKEAEKQAESQQVQPTLNEDAESGYAAAPVQTNPSLVQKPKEFRRPVKPVKEAPSKAKPQPVAIRVGTLSQRIPLMNPAVSSSLQDATAAPPQRPPGPVKKPSNASNSSNNLKSSVSSNVGKPKALLAAERKKEQDEKELQRKIEQKREIERKRAAQQEELRRQEQAQQQEAERQRERERLAAAPPDPKKLAQRQAIEKRRLENGKKEQQRQASQQEKNQSVPTNRQEPGGSRPPSRLHGFNNNDFGRSANQPPIGAVKPPGKRVFEPDIEEESTGPTHVQGGSLYPQLEAKRRRTDDEEFLEVAVRPTMLPPKRQSNARKDGPKQSIFGNGYTASHPPSHSYHQSSSLLKTSTLNQTYQQHQQYPSQVPRTGLPHEMAKYTNGKIPFAEAPNPPPKSPLRNVRPAAAPPPAAKSSPQYMNGENIDLAEIPTDSEDEESEDEKAKGAMLPEWVQSPLLRQQLEIQERYVDADAVFGPVRSPHMEEMFKGREHRLRNRTSSANWAGPDRLTEEEIRSDRAGREKLRRQGGWTFEL